MSSINQAQRGFGAVALLAILLASMASGVLGFWLGQNRFSGHQWSMGIGDWNDPGTALNGGARRQCSIDPFGKPDPIETEQREIQARIDVIAIRVARMQAELLRVNALGERLVKMAGLNVEDFDFANPAGSGGPDPGDESDNRLNEVTQDLDQVLAALDDRKHKLGLLETLIMERDLSAHSMPEGWPLKSGGMVTSEFGWRRHPLTGRRSMHQGIDIASRIGADILAVADGLVAFSGRKNGYGLIVEIRHANALETYYAHNQRNLVREGDLVRKGQVIAKLGSTGRSTGPHVHFEVRKNGRAVDPRSYLDASQPLRLAHF